MKKTANLSDSEVANRITQVLQAFQFDIDNDEPIAGTDAVDALVEIATILKNRRPVVDQKANQAEWTQEFGDHSECPVCGTNCEMLFVEGR